MTTKKILSLLKKQREAYEKAAKSAMKASNEGRLYGYAADCFLRAEEIARAEEHLGLGDAPKKVMLKVDGYRKGYEKVAKDYSKTGKLRLAADAMTRSWECNAIVEAIYAEID